MTGLAVMAVLGIQQDAEHTALGEAGGGPPVLEVRSPKRHKGRGKSLNLLNVRQMFSPLIHYAYSIQK